MKLGCVKPRFNLQQKTDIIPKTKHNSRIENTRQVSECILQLNNSINQLHTTRLLRQIITLCYSNCTNQFYLCNNLKIPFRDGPVAINKVPASFVGKGHQILSLFKYLQKVKQSYICWLIYNDTDLGILNLKLITQFQLSELNDSFQFGQALVGIFVGKQYHSKVRTVSTKLPYSKFHSNIGLSSQTTKDSLYDKNNKSNKNLKSVSMKQKKNLKHDYSSKTLGQHHEKKGSLQTSLKSDSGNKLTYPINKGKKVKN